MDKKFLFEFLAAYGAANVFLFIIKYFGGWGLHKLRERIQELRERIQELRGEEDSLEKADDFCEIGFTFQKKGLIYKKIAEKKWTAEIPFSDEFESWK